MDEKAIGRMLKQYGESVSLADKRRKMMNELQKQGFSEAEAKAIVDDAERKRANARRRVTSKAYDEKYRATRYYTINIRMNREKPTDAAIIAMLDSVGNMQGYIKALVLHDAGEISAEQLETVKKTRRAKTVSASASSKYRVVNIRMNREADADVIKRLKRVKNMGGYIKSLILADIAPK